MPNTIPIFFIFLFIFVSIINILYSILSQNGLYADGSYFFVSTLSNISANFFYVTSDPDHPRKVVSLIQYLPILTIGILFNIKSKLILSYIFSFGLYAIPLILLFLNYKLTKRTKQYSILFWSLFSYATTLIYGIYAITESIIGTQFYYLLLNYLLAKIKYTIIDQICILFLLITMTGIFEHTIFIGILFFIGACFCISKDHLPKSSKVIKAIIGIGSLFASIYTINYMSKINEESSEIIRFFNEAIPMIHNISSSNALFLIITIACLVYFYINRHKEIKNRRIIYVILSIYCITFLLLITPAFKPQINLEPRTRVISCILDTIIIFGIIFYHSFFHSKQTELIKKCAVPVLLYATFMGLWQILNCHYYNIDKNCILQKNTNYIASGFRLPTLIAFKNEYNITIEPESYPVLIEDIINGPYHNKEIQIKNRFYDITELVKNMDEYIKKDNKTINIYDSFRD